MLNDFSACHMREVDGHRHSGELLRQIGFNEHTAPEYALEDSIGRRSDQYSLASTVYWLLTGELPYQLTPNKLRSHTDLEELSYRSSRTHNPEITQELDDALRRALDPQRALRFRRQSEFLHALRVPLGRLPVQEDTRQEPRRHFWQGVAGVLLLLLVLSWLLR